MKCMLSDLRSAKKLKWSYRQFRTKLWESKKKLKSRLAQNWVDWKVCWNLGKERIRKKNS